MGTVGVDTSGPCCSTCAAERFANRALGLCSVVIPASHLLPYAASDRVTVAKLADILNVDVPTLR